MKTASSSHNPVLIIFTDLDGTLLNHGDYSCKEAKPALAFIRENSVPLIICTSKTRSEVRNLKNELGLNDPYITENGGGIFIPEGCSVPAPENASFADDERYILLGKTYQEIRQVFNRMKERYPVRGFGDMDVNEIRELTGLSGHQAETAKRREFTEPFVIQDKQAISEIEKMATESGLKIVKGGRFYHLIGSEQDKGRAVCHVMEMYRNAFGCDLITVGAGDSQNDFDMLKIVHYPILIPHPDGHYENAGLPDVIKAPHPGAKGWNESITALLQQFNIIRKPIRE